MSDNVKSRGFIAVLRGGGLTDDSTERLNDKFWKDKSQLSISYDGKLVFIDFFAHTRERDDIYGLIMGSYDEGDDFDRFVAELNKYGLEIVWGTSRTYSCIWYSGSDSPMSELTHDEFQKA